MSGRSSKACRLPASTGDKALAEALNARGVRTARCGQWHGATVGNILRRSAKIP
jgi:hypothetical protein